MTRFASETIFALASAPGRAGIAVIRISGAGAGSALAALAGRLPAPRRASLARLRDPLSGDILDGALTLWLPGPGSFTGEDLAELHVHGGRAVISGVVDALGRFDGLRPAEPGEFTRRAFWNGRLDLTEVEGLADLIDAETAAQRRQALRQSAGRLGAVFDAWRTEIIGILAHLEAAIDFADEEVPDDLVGSVRPRIASLREDIKRHLDDGQRGERLRSGYRVILAGPPNSGKSSLLNALARRDVAIVSEEAGTTRDVIEVSLDLSGYPVEIADTAGIREAVGAVEREGVRRSFAQAQAGDLVLWLMDAGDAAAPGPPPDLGAEVLCIPTKIDLIGHRPQRGISVRTGDGVDGLIGIIAEKARESLDVGDNVVVTRARHRVALDAVVEALTPAREGFESGPESLAEISVELQAERLRRAALELGRLTGRVDVEDLLDVIFADFCIGK